MRPWRKPFRAWSELLGKSDLELAGWREAFREALGPNGRLIIDLVPELKLIVGDQPRVPELPRSIPPIL
jgi:predicted ATPase